MFMYFPPLWGARISGPLVDDPPSIISVTDNGSGSIDILLNRPDIGLNYLVTQNSSELPQDVYANGTPVTLTNGAGTFNLDSDSYSSGTWYVHFVAHIGGSNFSTVDSSFSFAGTAAAWSITTSSGSASVVSSPPFSANAWSISISNNSANVNSSP